MPHRIRRFLWILLPLLWLQLALTVVAQTEPTPTPEPTEAVQRTPETHIVQEGETLFGIAAFYETTVEDIQRLNGIDDSDFLFVGQELLIPFEGMVFVPTGYVVQFGDTLEGIAEKFGTTAVALARQNPIISERSLYAGQVLNLVSETGSVAPSELVGVRHVVAEGDTLATIAVQYGVSPAAIVVANQMQVGDQLFLGQPLRIPVMGEYLDLPGGWQEIEMGPLPAVQGRTLSVRVDHREAGTANGRLRTPEGEAIPLVFAPDPDGVGQVALVGLDAFDPIGFYTLELEGDGPARAWQPFAQRFQIGDANYITQALTIPAELGGLLDPQIRTVEDIFLETIFTQSNETPYWEGLFTQPISAPVSSPYGVIRSYNGGPFNIFHTGIDFAGGIATPIYAPANGVVVFNDFLELRGNALIIDHGLGVMTAYYHLSGTNVAVGDAVVQGQAVASGGNTGLSTGPHLHWDVRVNGKAVDPVQWTQQAFP